jgi:hypothetical protein
MNSPTPIDSRELAHRANDGVEVTLYWSKTEDRLFVTVNDARSGDAFELPAERHNALEIFEHPYAQAAFLGIGYCADRCTHTERVHA